MELPLRHQDTKTHKDFIFSDIALVQLGALVPWWQKIHFGVDSTNGSLENSSCTRKGKHQNMNNLQF